ncbi:MAG TPA: thiamine pyrophosphate-dependent enzyme [Ktedonobacterales bacterium]
MAHTTAGPVTGMVGPDGALTAEGERAAGVTTQTLRRLYELLVLCRRLDQEGLHLQRQGELGLWGPIAGHEAVQVGAALAMAPTDWIVPYYRDYGMAVTRGIDPAVAMTWFRGLTHGAWKPRDQRFGPLIISVGSQMPHAAGLALGCKLDKEATAVLVSSGEGATSTGDWHETMNYAGVFQLPLVILCENNQWAISVPMRKQVAGRIADRAAGYGFPGVRIDGTDVLTVYAMVRAAAERARAGDGPMLIESMSYRFLAHTTSDDPTRYRTEEEAEEWKRCDPVLRAEQRLKARNAFDEAYAQATRDAAEGAALRMRSDLLAAQADHPGAIFDHVFKNPPAAHLRERDVFLADIEPGGE